MNPTTQGEASMVQTQPMEKIVDNTAETLRGEFENFLINFQTPEDEAQGYKTYLEQIEVMKHDTRNTLFIDFDHMLQFKEGVMAQAIQEGFFRFESYLRKGLQNVVRKFHPEFARTDKQFKDFFVAIYGIPSINKIRELKTDKVGKLLTITGTVTRTSEIRPELLYGTFSCVACNSVIRLVEQQFKYTEPTMCPNPTCQNRQQWLLNVDQSKFIDWQRIRVQENSSEIPAGSMPRSLDVILRNEIVDRAKPGDKCVFTGTLIVVPEVAQLSAPGKRAEVSREAKARTKDVVGNEGVYGLKALGVRDLSYKLAFLASMIQPADTRFGTVNIREDNDVDDPRAIVSQFSPQEIQEILKMKNDPQIYSKLVNSIAPNVFGHETIKKGVLLMLFGGVHKETVGDLKLRGDINVCIVGDPSTAKSQFLKYVVSFLPRGVYTSGKASTAAGLTASVARDDETGEFTIEAGALMLADNGVCCIDEFDKMDMVDQIAIHEAMEQQTISIAKAGIQATLNARTSILAAANPHGGRYDPTKSLKSNVAMTPAIMSRFDLFFVIIDECDEASDFNIAKHIVSLHRQAGASSNSEQTFMEDLNQPEYSTEQLQRYIKFARTLKPKINPESAQLLTDFYRKLRQNDSGVGKSSYRITVRQLESLIRLSEALARLHCDDQIKPRYVKEAYNLLQKSIIHVKSEEVQLEEENQTGFQHGHQDVTPAEQPNKKMRMETTEEEPQTQTQTKRITIPFERYEQIAKSILRYMTRTEEAESNGTKRSEIIGWYLELIQDEINTEEDLLYQQSLIGSIITRLSNRDNVLIPLTFEQTEDGQEEDPVFIIHPDYPVN